MFKVLTLPLLVSICLHGLIAAAVIIGMPDTSPVVKKAPPSFIKATLVTLDKPQAKPKPAPKSPKKRPPPSKKQSDKSTKLAAAKRAKQIKLKQQRAKQQKQQLQEKQRKEQAQQEQLRREQELQRRDMKQQELLDAIASEHDQQVAETDAELATTYTALISERITDSWSRPPSARNNMQVELMLDLVPTGEVINVTVVKSSGNAEFDRSAELAVKRTERFPELQQLPIRAFEKYFRRFRLIFRPEDLRQ